GHPALGIKNLLLDVVDGQEVADIVELGPAFLSAFAPKLMTVVAFLKLPLILADLEEISASRARRGGRAAGSAGRLRGGGLIAAQGLDACSQRFGLFIERLRPRDQLFGFPLFCRSPFG